MMDLNSKIMMFVCVRCRSGVSLLSKQVKTAKSTTTTSGKKSSGSSTKVSKACGKTGNVDKAAGKAVDAHKFELYFDFKAYINAIKPHQVGVFFYSIGFVVVVNVTFSDYVINLQRLSLTFVSA